MVGSSRRERAGSAESAAEQRSGGLLRRAGRTTVAVCVLGGLALGLGFLLFANSLPTEETTFTSNADGIVVLTGGASRITDALELLAAKRGQRLLISGANRSTNTAEIVRLHPEFSGAVRCCVDFDRSLNTLGNAVETRRWAEERGMRSLIVVTSAYHMPRAMAEIAHQLPGVALVAFPVLSDKMRAEPWWSNGTTARLILLEYLKYVFTHVRMRVNPNAGLAD